MFVENVTERNQTGD